MYFFSLRHFISMKDLTEQDICYLLDQAEGYLTTNRQRNKKTSTLKGLTHINLFFEASTRTQTSFEIAGKRLGADVINISLNNSSIKKEETFLDTVATLNAMHPDLLVIRHPCSGTMKFLLQEIHGPTLINAGDGTHEHPTQALLDALTIRSVKGHLENLIVTICGDILHSRVARSNIILLNTMGAHVRVVGPKTLLPARIEDMGVKVFHTMEEGLKDADVIMMLRPQNERMLGVFIPSIQEYSYYYSINVKNIKIAKEDALVMHPGPMNRGVEISSAIADGSQSVIQKQVEMGIAVRMAVIQELLRH
ncbi:LOW QUALITY PROTEIN: Aspartate carbamoyltransferase [Liberibacter crescens BT-1]|uniref:Aspartate carbamoyltransferase n=1 Tax=Liberibacter crescens (strain BT-1) TaxID=1215343 RepID=L0EVF9_LIBCB|nr:LOW QUALITY PROTEIN: Aspartate carbamoyltransferase [Liberibacter crescens BT-1]